MMPMSITEIIALSNIDPNDLDYNDAKVMRLEDKQISDSHFYFDIGMIDRATFIK